VRIDHGGGQMPDPDPGATFAAAVRLRRRQLGLGQGELADLAGVSERFVYALERGKPSVQLDKVMAVLSALGLHLELHRGSSATIVSVDGAS
jgi:HTH-type transcriptional regulator/antitoxin HipB